MTRKRRINIVTLGCAKNIVDSEHLAGQLGPNWEVEYDSDSTDAKVVVVNTCGFIGDAKQESIDTILRFAAAREAGDIDHLFVMGCLSERYRDELREEIPEVDEFFGVNNLKDILRTVGERYRDELRGERRLTTPKHYAYLKISEGCNWGCGYCAIPLIRGRHVSVPFEELLAEAEALAAKGVRELIVIAQDTTYYGLDLYGKRRLGELLRALCRIDGIEWVRLHYAYPAHFPQDVIEAMRDEPKICKYLDIPLQHISDRMLRSMRRGLGKAETVRLVEELRRQIPDIALRTTLLVGYPGETEQDFRELLDFVTETRFDRLGVFPYSEEEGTYSASELTDDVPPQVKEERAEAVMELQRDIARTANERLVGTIQKIIVDRREGDFWVGRTQYDSPEVDQEVLVPAGTAPRAGTFLTVRIVSADDYDLRGEPV
ncbi:30S ribosomal protein S12 methylthiotransferase RimO [Rikenella microfusus]|uniref:30S ribosomal protein S12 methylthiotransferase RimO n=1 Tax=Rikenella microfusus TaxID=28139 RepID=UPI001D546C37|nr:30S ribosomal protein S12 methylthiotransferase RimO [Rikenella microfusus]HJE88488.1 30S ribosomal protein S12 methylthiotransferase RimO [Rikenella microfusus]